MVYLKNVSAERVMKHISEISRFGVYDGKSKRYAFGPDETRAIEYVGNVLSDMGISAETDGFGNLHGATGKSDKYVRVGSHVDSVIDGGLYDGVLGVAAGIEVLNVIRDSDINTIYPIELNVFRAEESTAFGQACLGSQAATGKLDKKDLGLKYKIDGDGPENLEAAIRSIGLEPLSLAFSRITPDNTIASYEMHIEQADVLNSIGKPLGVINIIAAPERYEIKLKGHTDHSGATPMNSPGHIYRKNAGVAGSRIAVDVRDAAEAHASKGKNVVATIGKIEIPGGSMNVVPGYCNMLLDIRGTDITERDELSKEIQEKIKRIAKEEYVHADLNRLSYKHPVELSEKSYGLLQESCDELGIPYHLMSSGAGHDVMNLPEPSLLFVRSYGGSHNPEERVDKKDAFLGTRVLTNTLVKAARKL